MLAGYIHWGQLYMFTKVLLNFLRIQLTKCCKGNCMVYSIKNYDGIKRREIQLFRIMREIPQSYTHWIRVSEQVVQGWGEGNTNILPGSSSMGSKHSLFGGLYWIIIIQAHGMLCKTLRPNVFLNSEIFRFEKHNMEL